MTNIPNASELEAMAFGHPATPSDIEEFVDELKSLPSQDDEFDRLIFPGSAAHLAVELDFGDYGSTVVNVVDTDTNVPDFDLTIRADGELYIPEGFMPHVLDAYKQVSRIKKTTREAPLERGLVTVTDLLLHINHLQDRAASVEGGSILEIEDRFVDAIVHTMRGLRDDRDNFGGTHTKTMDWGSIGDFGEVQVSVEEPVDLVGTPERIRDAIEELPIIEVEIRPVGIANIWLDLYLGNEVDFYIGHDKGPAENPLTPEDRQFAMMFQARRAVSMKNQGPLLDIYSMVENEIATTAEAERYRAERRTAYQPSLANFDLIRHYIRLGLKANEALND